MATTTTNYGLKKPSYNDNADISVINSNMDIIDAKMKEIENAGGGGGGTVDAYTKSETDALLSGKVGKVDGKGLSTNDYSTEEKQKLDGIEDGANKTVVDSALSSTSANPVQNKVVNIALDNKVDKEIVSDAWNASTTYAVGQYCIYNNSLWKCKVQHNGQTPTEGTYWTNVTVANEIASVNSSLSNKQDKIAYISDLPSRSTDSNIDCEVVRSGLTVDWIYRNDLKQRFLAVNIDGRYYGLIKF